MTDWIAWFMLAAAAVLVVGVRLRPLGKNSRRGQLAVAGFMALMAITRMAEPVDTLRSVLLVAQLILAVAGIGFTLLSFRPGELPGTRKDP
jgi:hypothetical protein